MRAAFQLPVRRPPSSRLPDGSCVSAGFESCAVIGVAKTGSGKTLAFLAPAFRMIEEERRGGGGGKGAKKGPRCLVLAPTRELAIQIRDEAVKFGRSSGIGSVVVYGGAPRGGQLAELRREPPVVVATPGRLNDFLEFRQISLGTSAVHEHMAPRRSPLLMRTFLPAGPRWPLLTFPPLPALPPLLTRRGAPVPPPLVLQWKCATSSWTKPTACSTWALSRR